jgi:PhnB protein
MGQKVVTPYLVFNGNCKEALDFYQKVFGCEEARLMPYGEYVPDGIETPTIGFKQLDFTC